MADTCTDGIADALCAAVDEDRVAALLSEMVRIESVNPFDGEPRAGAREQEFADWFCAQMAGLGLEVDRRDVVAGRPNVWGVRRGSGGGPSLMLAGHMDTVGVEGCLEPFSGRIADGRVHGRGACDMKAALAAYLEVVSVLNDAGVALAGDLIVAGVVDEEHRMIGSKDWGRHGPHADFGIIGEPSQLAVCHAHKGQLCFVLRTHGRAVHSSVPERGINAIQHMARVIAAFEDYNAELAGRQPHPLCGHGRFSPGVIHGGTISSAVPDLCELEVDRRFVPGETRASIEAEYRARLDALAAEVPDFRYEIAGPTLEAEALDIPADAPIVHALCAAVEAVTGAPARIEAGTGATDAPNMGFPCVICGPGSLDQAHTIDEYVETAQLADAARVYLRTILAMVGTR